MLLLHKFPFFACSHYNLAPEHMHLQFNSLECYSFPLVKSSFEYFFSIFFLSVWIPRRLNLRKICTWGKQGTENRKEKTLETLFAYW